MDKEKGDFIPNSFQTPNIYLDRILPLLDPPEFVVLMFAVRHILGWSDNAQHQAKLSISSFEKGCRGQPGCGLSRVAITAILNRLEKFGLLRRVGKPDAEGQTWKLVFDEKQVAWVALEARQTARLETNQKRTKTARIRRKENLEQQAASPEVVSPTNQPSGMSDLPAGGLSDIPTGGLSDKPEVVSGTYALKPIIETHIETQEKIFATSPHGESQAGTSKNENSPIPEKVKTKPVPKPKSETIPAELMNPMKDAIAAAFDWSWCDMTDNEKGQIQKAAKQLCKVNFSAADIPKLYRFCERKFDHFGPMALPNNVSNYRQNGGVKHGISTSGRPSWANEDGTVKRLDRAIRESFPHTRSQTG